ncbi:hypothetical protein GLOTRDRAFT_92473 [Gloeophyllum trabeum ATCC 11539]|uniref:Uncharacterized protein n=1 Tax=Gloeophyllum trabeum (strain ATCC 11539 / FP-39264 / Madison 617) TaxID=670483 RepID=S7QBW2_GLOTA|nr:uncharacterized protein GLOTRDRAFT_92473 [Gloeophyllum trabeum ATCC 11539]EPQ57446.1 hypothetical protein GLOTRDRAFT_92473 [Gloeophyllum trabeum ATCC 11539]
MKGIKTRIRKVSNDLGNKISGAFKGQPKVDDSAYRTIHSLDYVKNLPRVGGRGPDTTLYALRSLNMQEEQRAHAVNPFLSPDDPPPYRDHDFARAPRRSRTISTPGRSASGKGTPQSRAAALGLDTRSKDYSISSALRRFPEIPTSAPDDISAHRRAFSNEEYMSPPMASTAGARGRSHHRCRASEDRNGTSRPPSAAPGHDARSRNRPYVVPTQDGERRSYRTREPSATRGLERSRMSNHKRTPSETRQFANSDAHGNVDVISHSFQGLWSYDGASNAADENRSPTSFGKETVQSRRPSYTRFVGDSAHVHQPQVIAAQTTRPVSHYPEVIVPGEELLSPPPLPIPVPFASPVPVKQSSLGLSNLEAPKAAPAVHTPWRGRRDRDNVPPPTTSFVPPPTTTFVPFPLQHASAHAAARPTPERKRREHAAPVRSASPVPTPRPLPIEPPFLADQGDSDDEVAMHDKTAEWVRKHSAKAMSHADSEAARAHAHDYALKEAQKLEALRAARRAEKERAKAKAQQGQNGSGHTYYQPPTLGYAQAPAAGHTCNRAHPLQTQRTEGRYARAGDKVITPDGRAYRY